MYDNDTLSIIYPIAVLICAVGMFVFLHSNDNYYRGYRMEWDFSNTYTTAVKATVSILVGFVAGFALTLTWPVIVAALALFILSFGVISAIKWAGSTMKKWKNEKAGSLSQDGEQYHNRDIVVEEETFSVKE